MKYSKLSLLTVGLLSAFISVEVSAAGLGRMNIYSGLGQPLNAEIDIIANPQELQTMSAQLASPSAFANAGVQFAEALKNNQVYFQIVKKNNGKSVLKLTSKQPFNEPFLDFLVELNWSAGKLVREYTFLLNPARASIQSPVSENTNNTNNTNNDNSTNNFQENYQNSFGFGDINADEENQNQNDEITPLNQARQNINNRYQQRIKNQNNQNKQNNNENNNSTSSETSDNQNNSYLVKNGDTLRQIAERVQQNNPNVTLEQMLFAIYQNNPDAFIGKNINLLKSGVNLQIPSENQVSQMISPNDARKSYRQQTAVWANYRKKIANQTSAINSNNLKNNNATSSQSVQGKITPEIQEHQPQNISNQRDRLKISTTENANANGINERNSKNNSNNKNQFNELQQQINELKARADAAELDRVAKEQALQESQSRVRELEKNVEDLNNLLAVKNQQLANLEKISSENSKPANAKAQPAPTTPPAEVVKPQQEQSQAPKKIKPKPNGDEIFDKGDEKDNSDQGGIISKNLGTIGGSLMILSLLGAGIVVLRNKKRKLEEQHKNENDSNSNSPADNKNSEKNNQNLVENNNENSNNDEAEQEINETEENNDFLDPLQEAQNYIDANQYDKAEEILLNAFNQDTTNTAFMAKLLEIYAHQSNTERFENIARQLQNIVGNDSEDWIQTKALGHQIDPTNQLYLDEEISEDNPADDLLNSLDDTDGFTQSEPEPENDSLESLLETESEPEPEPLAEVETETEPEPEPENQDDNEDEANDLLDDDDEEPEPERKPVEEAHLESAVDSAILPQEGSVRTDMALDFDSLDSAEEENNDEDQEPSLEEMASQHTEEDDSDLLDNLESFDMGVEEPEETEELPAEETPTENLEEVVSETETELEPENSAENEILENTEDVENIENIENAENVDDLEDFQENSENIFDKEINEVTEEAEQVAELEETQPELEAEINQAIDNAESSEIAEDDIAEEISEPLTEEPENEIAENIDDANELEFAAEAEPEESETTDLVEDLENTDLDLEEEDQPLNEAETKFELAKAYEEMGDLEGAIDLWSELMVSPDASPEIIQQAKEHLDKLPTQIQEAGGSGNDVDKLL